MPDICPTTGCGTGGWSGPLPGDPDNNLILTATPAYGGVDVNWTYPTLNGHAVIHTYLYRGITDDFNLSVRQAIVSGNFYYDRIPKAEIRQYYYWIQVVSVNGTVGDVIGPASATPMDSILEVMQDLTGLIDSGVLATTLKEKIDKIDFVYQELVQETLDRLAEITALTGALAAVKSETGEALAYIQNETTSRVTADEALINSVNALAVGMSGNSAAILNEKTSRINADEALASDIDVLYTNFNSNTAAILSEKTARTDADSALVTSINSLVTRVGASEGAIVTEQQVRSTADASIISSVSTLTGRVSTTEGAITNEANLRIAADSLNASNITSLNGRVGTAEGAIRDESTLRINGDSALASSISTVQSSLGNQLASVQTSLTTSINAVDNKASALYTAKVDVNGLIGGFGIYNDSQTVEAGFDVDRFWVGRTTNKVKPFIIEGGTVYINEAAINKVTINKLRSESGSLVFENDKLKADYINVTSLNVGAFTGYTWPAAGLGGAHLSAAGLLLGNPNGGGKYFQIASGYGTGGNAAISTNIPAYIEDAQITSAKVANATITSANIADLTLGGRKFAGAVTVSQYVVDSVTHDTGLGRRAIIQVVELIPYDNNPSVLPGDTNIAKVTCDSNGIITVTNMSGWDNYGGYYYGSTHFLVTYVYI